MHSNKVGAKASAAAATGSILIFGMFTVHLAMLCDAGTGPSGAPDKLTRHLCPTRTNSPSTHHPVLINPHCRQSYLAWHREEATSFPLPPDMPSHTAPTFHPVPFQGSRETTPRFRSGTSVIL